MSLSWKNILARVLAVGTLVTMATGNVALAGNDGGGMPSNEYLVVSSSPFSGNWAGYVVDDSLLRPSSGAISNVKADWTVPTLTCDSSRTYSSAWVGIDGYGSSTVEQTGTWHYCINGQPVYGAFYEMYPDPVRYVNLRVRPGDHMSGEVQYVGGDRFTVTLRNLTTGKRFSTTASRPGAERRSAEVVLEAPNIGGTRPLADVGTVQFRNASVTVNGVAGAIADLRWHNQPLVMLSPSGQHLAAPSLLSLDGRSFSAKRLLGN